MPDRQPSTQLVDLANSFERGRSYLVENAVFAIEIGFVIEHRIDRVVEQLPAVRRDERGDQRVEIGDAVTLHHGFERRAEAQTSELQSIMRNTYAGVCLKNKKTNRQ